MGWLTGDSPKDQMDLLNQQIDPIKADYDKYLQMIQGIIGGSGYDFLGPKTTTTTGTTTGTTSGTRDIMSVIDQLSMPNVSAAYKPLEGQMMQVASNRLHEPLPPGLAEMAARDTNRAFAGAEAKIRNEAARTGRPIEGPMMPVQSARAAALADITPKLALEQMDRQGEAVDLAAKLTGMFGTGQHTTGTNRSTEMSSGVSSGTTAGQATAPGSIQELLAYLGMLQPFQPPIMQPQPRQGALGGLFGLAGQLPWGKWF